MEHSSQLARIDDAADNPEQVEMAGGRVIPLLDAYLEASIANGDLTGAAYIVSNYLDKLCDETLEGLRACGLIDKPPVREHRFPLMYIQGNTTVH